MVCLLGLHGLTWYIQALQMSQSSPQHAFVGIAQNGWDSIAQNMCGSIVLCCLQMVVSSYEARQEELMQENKGLQAALADLQSDHWVLANKQAAAQQLQAAAVRNLVEEEDLQDGLQHLDAAEVQAELFAKMAAMKQRIEAVYDGPMPQVQLL